MKGKKLAKKLAYMRLDGLLEDKDADRRLCGFLKRLGTEERTELEEILVKECELREQRERRIYLMGFKDGAGLVGWL